MVKLCERPGCSEPGAVAYGMVPEDLLFWMSTLADARSDDPNVLCRRHADAMVVPLGWTLDDRREDTLRLFTSRPIERAPSAAARPRRARSRSGDHDAPEQLQIDGTGEITRPDGAALDEAVASVDPADEPAVTAAESDESERPDEPVDVAAESDESERPDEPVDVAAEPAPTVTADRGGAPWQPDFDADDDLGGLLEVSSPLLARAFRGTDRRKS